jgi:hypothetical protein
MVLVDYSKGHGYSILVEDGTSGVMLIKEKGIKDFDFALSGAQDYAAEGSEGAAGIIEPVVSLPAIRAILRAYAKKIVSYAALMEPVEDWAE